jgi:hypothetical protein
MKSDQEISLRPARSGDALAVFNITKLSVVGLAKGHYSTEQIAAWMGDRTPKFYEVLISKGRTVVAEHAGAILGFCGRGTR